MAEVPEVVEPVVNQVEFFTNETDQNFETLEACREFLNGEQRRTFLLDRAQFTDIKLGKDSDNKVTIDFGNGELPLNRTGFSRLCKITRSPENYLASLPLENIRKDIVARLLNDAKLKQINFIIKNDHVVGASTRENTLGAAHFLNNAFQTNHKTFKNIGISNERLVVDFISDEQAPIPNDTFGFGISCFHDDTTGLYPMVAPYSFRMVCSNGVVHRETLGKVRFSARMDSTKMFEVLNQRFTELPTQLYNKYQEVLSTMINAVIQADEKPFLKSYLGSEFDWENGIDGTQQFDEQINNKGDANYYDLMNFLTNYANQFDLRTRREIQMVGGRMFDYFGNMNNELFAGYSEFKRKKVAELASA